MNNHDSVSVFENFVDVMLASGGLVVALTNIYIDESGTHDGSRVMSLGGYAFMHYEAKRFSKNRQRDLKKIGLPYAHMKECTGGSGVYSHLNKQQCVDSVKSLISEIHKRSLFGFSVVLDPRHWHPIMSPLGDKAPTVYSFMMFSVMQIIQDWIVKESYKGKISYFLEAGHKDQADANSYLNQLVDDPDGAGLMFSYAGHAFLKKEDCPPLQAADLIAWQTRKYVDDRIQKGKINPRKDLEALSRPIDVIKILTGDTVTAFRNHMLEQWFKKNGKSVFHGHDGSDFLLLDPTNPSKAKLRQIYKDEYLREMGLSMFS